MRILCVEDDAAIANGVAYALREAGYAVCVCGDYASGLVKSVEDFDLFLLDVVLPDGSGFDLLTEIRKYCPAPVIFLTAADEEDAVVKGLDLGAEDYITKPFSTRELLARIRRLHRAGREHHALVIGEVCLDFDSRTVTKNGVPIAFTPLEYRILAMLAQNAGQIVTRELLLDKIWDLSGNYVNDNTLTVYLRRIRTKLGIDCIQTVKGVGYRLEVV